jgi:hypothetical protein
MQEPCAVEHPADDMAFSALIRLITASEEFMGLAGTREAASGRVEKSLR